MSHLNVILASTLLCSWGTLCNHTKHLTVASEVMWKQGSVKTGASSAFLFVKKAAHLFAILLKAKQLQLINSSAYAPCIQYHNWWNHPKAMFFLPRRKGSGWQKSWLHSVPSQQIRNTTREAQRNQDSLLQTAIVFISKAGLKQAVQTAEM